MTKYLSLWCKGGRIRTRKTSKRKGSKSKRQRNIRKLLPVLLLAQTAVTTGYVNDKISFSSSHFKVGIDSRASACISNQTNDFIGVLTPVKVTLKTYSTTSTTELLKGTIRWYWNDETGQEHKFDIPNSYYDPNGSRLLSPQHWAKELKAQKSYREQNVYYVGNDKTLSIHWGKYFRTVDLVDNNVANVLVRNQYKNHHLKNETTEQKKTLPNHTSYGVNKFNIPTRIMLK